MRELLGLRKQMALLSCQKWRLGAHCAQGPLAMPGRKARIQGLLQAASSWGCV